MSNDNQPYPPYGTGSDGPQYPSAPGQMPYGSPQPNQMPYGATPPNQAPYGSPQPNQMPYGGVPQPVPYGYQPKSKVAAGLLGIFLGVFGVHNFYLGFTGKAVTQLLITVLSLGFLSMISAIWGLVEGILILTSNPTSPWNYDANGVMLTS